MTTLNWLFIRLLGHIVIILQPYASHKYAYADKLQRVAIEEYDKRVTEFFNL